MSAVLAPPLSPFKGLAAFGDSELDGLFFFGRERERAVLVANLVAVKLTLLYGESGVGKSSLLAAGVVRELRAQSPDAAVLLHDVWSLPPVGVLDAVRDAPEAYVILDQFEEHFLYEAGGAEDLLPALLAEPHVQVLISLREDALAQLDVFKARVPFVFANQVRLEHLDRTAARSAILGPIERWNELTGEEVSVEPALVDAVLDEVHVEGRGDDRIEAPYLQLVLEQIWERERAAGSTVLRVATLDALGGAAAIVRGHLRGALATLSPPEQDVAAEMFAHLITPSGTKIAHNAADLADYADVPPDLLRRILATLTRDRVVHSVNGSDRYEIFHDVLVEPIQSWRLQRRLEHERRVAARRQRRLAAIAVATAIALGIVALVALFALAQRSRAREEARNARAEATESHARELAANSLVKLGNDPVRSLALALAAARLERSEHIAEVLRTALDSSHLDLIVPTHGAATAAALSPDARRVLAADATGHAAVYAVATARRLASFRVPGRVFTASFAPDGRHVLVAGGGRLIFAGGGRKLVLVHRGVRDAVFGAGGSEIASGGTDGTVRLWNVADGALLGTFRPGGVVHHVALSPRGDRLAVSWTGGEFDHVSLYTM